MLSTYEQRTLKKFSDCLTFASNIHCFEKYCGLPKTMTSRKFYRCHFHSLTVHAPETFRLVCPRSLIMEQEERSFGDVRSISLHTANRQCRKLIDNTVLRYNAQHAYNNKKDYAIHHNR